MSLGYPYGNFVFIIQNQKMKLMRHLSILLTASAILALGACKKDKDKDPEPSKPGTTSAYTCTNCVTAPEAKAEHDGSSRGIYKGILVASTGTIKFNVANDGNTINAIMVIDGETVNLTSSITWEADKPYVAPFTGTMSSGPVSITFEVDQNGGDPRIISSSIPGHPNATFTLAKETSNALIEGFEGKYEITDGEKGNFNILLSRTLKKWGGVARETGSTEEDDINGTMNGDKIIDKNGKTLGTLTKDEISGTFQNGDGETVTISAKRTL
jgi:hypothetical protein